MLEQSEFCPYCERPLDGDDGGEREGSGSGRSARALLITAAALCTALAIVSAVAATLV